MVRFDIGVGLEAVHGGGCGNNAVGYYVLLYVVSYIQVKTGVVWYKVALGDGVEAEVIKKSRTGTWDLELMH